MFFAAALQRFFHRLHLCCSLAVLLEWRILLQYIYLVKVCKIFVVKFKSFCIAFSKPTASRLLRSLPYFFTTGSPEHFYFPQPVLGVWMKHWVNRSRFAQWPLHRNHLIRSLSVGGNWTTQRFLSPIEVMTQALQPAATLISHVCCSLVRLITVRTHSDIMRRCRLQVPAVCPSAAFNCSNATGTAIGLHRVTLFLCSLKLRAAICSRHSTPRVASMIREKINHGTAETRKVY